MKIRNDFISNSSSTSFVVCPQELRYSIFSGLRSGKLKYPEFAGYLDFYDGIVLRYNDITKPVIDKLSDYAENTEGCFMADTCSESWRSSDFGSYMHSHYLDIFNVDRIKAEDDHAGKTRWPIESYDYFYNGKKLNTSDQDEIEKAFRFKEDFKYISIRSRHYFSSNDIPGDSYVLTPFLLSLSQEEFETFMSAVTAMFSMVQDDGLYAYDDPKPAELKILEKYNTVEKQ